MNRGERRRESKLGRAQALDLEGIKNNDPQALQGALQAIDANVRQQRLMKARRLCDSALAANPKNSQLNFALGVVHQAKSDAKRATEAYQQAVSINPDYLAAWVNLGICARGMKSYDTAIKALKRASQIDPGSFHAHYNLALAYCDVKDMDSALASLNAALAIEPASPEAQFQMGFLQELLTNHLDAAHHYRQVIGANPNSDLAHTHAGSCLQIVGRFAEGAEHLKTAIELNPSNGRAQYLLASSEQAVTDPGFKEVLEQQLYNRELLSTDLANLHFAAGRLEERAQDYHRAFQHYEAGNKIRNAAYQQNPDDLITKAERIKSVFSRDYVAKLSAGGNPTDRPVFVVGVPRSGTTLVEQIISSHPKGYGAGELSNMLDMCTLPGADLAAPYPDRLADVTAEDVARMAERYLGDYPAGAEGAARVVDKTPGNAMWLGMIAAMFPNAAIIHCERDPMDVLWSFYAQNFYVDVPYACDFNNLAAYYGQHARSMEHWREILPVSITNISYEALVADPEAVIPKVIAAAGLEWDDRCLDFHAHDRSVTTTSLWQVRRPMFKSSVDKWKRFEADLGELKTALERYAPDRAPAPK